MPTSSLRAIAGLFFAAVLSISRLAHADDTDLVYVNGVVLTVDENDSVAHAVAVEDGRIIAVGSNKDIRKHAGKDTRIVDLHGRTMLPGFIDAHGHFLIAGRNETIAVDLNSPPIGDVRTMSELRARISERAQSTPGEDWIIGLGYDDTLLAENRHPTRHDLGAPRLDLSHLPAFRRRELARPKNRRDYQRHATARRRPYPSRRKWPCQRNPRGRPRILPRLRASSATDS